MGTFLFDEIIFGPVKSRRLGKSLGINLLPTNRKVCNYNCIYCECGLNPKTDTKKASKLPLRDEVKAQLTAWCETNRGDMPDTITFAGNGEPTLHKDFYGIIEDTIKIRDTYCKDAKIAVLSNATRLHMSDVKAALERVDLNILKLDSAIQETIMSLNCPTGGFALDMLTENLIAMRDSLIIQTMFVKGTYEGKIIDNTTNVEIREWLKLIKKISPRSVMIYTIARHTPIETLEKIPLAILNNIAHEVRSLGIETQVSG